jgi:hypothetical protein
MGEFIVGAMMQEQLAYIAGLVASDGTITRNKRTFKIKIVTSNLEFAVKIFGIMRNYCNAKIRENKGRKTYNVYCYSKRLARVLNEEYMIKYGRKASHIRLPRRLPDKLMMLFIRGLFDGDSSVMEVKVRLKRNNREYVYNLPRITFKSKSEKLVSEVHSYLEKKGISTYTWVDKGLHVLAIDGIRNLRKFHFTIGYMHPDKHSKIMKILFKYRESRLHYYGESAGDGVRNSSPAEPWGPEDWSGLKPAAETLGHGSCGAVIR